MGVGPDSIHPSGEALGRLDQLLHGASYLASGRRRLPSQNGCERVGIARYVIAQFQTLFQLANKPLRQLSLVLCFLASAEPPAPATNQERNANARAQ